MDSVNPNITCHNTVDENGNPTGGFVMLICDKDDTHINALTVNWQDGPRGRDDGTLSTPNGAFVEDVLFAAKQRLEFFQNSKYASEYNSKAIASIDEALSVLTERTKERADRGVEGKHEV